LPASLASGNVIGRQQVGEIRQLLLQAALGREVLNGTAIGHAALVFLLTAGTGGRINVRLCFIQITSHVNVLPSLDSEATACAIKKTER